MSRDRYERRHRRTVSNDACVEMMTGADFDAVPSLGEAMGLEQPVATHTHVGYRPHVGHVHCGAKLHGHRIPKAGHTHALTGGPTRFTALCGETVDLASRFDEWGDEVRPNVVQVAEARPVTCKRCLRAALAEAKRILKKIEPAT